MSLGGIAALACIVTGPLVMSACAGGSGNSQTPAQPAAASPQTETPPPSQAANDPAAAAPEALDPATATGAVKGVPSPTNTTSIEAVANYFTEIPGFDLTTLDAPHREKFLHRINSELCTCGCKNDTLAQCIVNDPKCPSVKGLVQTVYDEVKASR
jgi:ABC-type transport system substrate-binding protein